MAASGTAGLISFVLLLSAVAASVVSFTRVKDHTGTSTGFEVATIIAAIISASIGSTGPAGVILIVLGAIVTFVGNKQLAAGIRS